MSLFIHGEKGVLDSENNSFYSRSSHSAQKRLSACLSNHHATAEFYPDCLITTSGMHAIHTALFTAVEEAIECNIIYGNQLYCDTSKLIKTQLSHIPQYCIDSKNSEEIFSIFRELHGQNNILFVESCSNPCGYLFDFEIIPSLRKLSKNLTVIVDNTWLTHVILNPFCFDVDVIVLSLTKYYSGGSAIMGACLSRMENFIEKSFARNKNLGIHVSVPECELVLNNMTCDDFSMEKRLTDSSQLTVVVAQYLAEDERLQASEVYHPSLSSHPSYDLAKKFFNACTTTNKILYPSVLAFLVPASKSKVCKVMKNNTRNHGMDFLTSFGSEISRIDSFPASISDGKNGEASLKKVRLRLALGFGDNSNRVINSLDILLGCFC